MKLSICVPTYNRQEKLERLIKAFLEQYPSDTELCISDNGNFQTPFHFPIIRYRRNRENIEFDRNLYEALKMGWGEWLWIMGDDDKPKNIERLIGHLNPRYCDFVLLGWGGLKYPNYFMTSLIVKKSVFDNLDKKWLERGFNTKYFHAWLQMLLFAEGKTAAILPQEYYETEPSHNFESLGKEFGHYVPWIRFRFWCLMLAISKGKNRVFFTGKFITSFFYLPSMIVRHIIDEM